VQDDDDKNLIERLRVIAQEARDARVPVELFCPQCKVQHVDQGEWAHEISHRKHLCHACQHVWLPYPVGTVGVDLHIPCREKQDRLEADWTQTVEDNRLLAIRRDELLAMVANLSQTVPLESEVAEALNQRGALLAEIGTLKATIAEHEPLFAQALNDRAFLDAILDGVHTHLKGPFFPDPIPNTVSGIVDVLRATREAFDFSGVMQKVLSERNEKLVLMITTLQQGIRDVCAIATTPLPEDRQVVIEVGKLAKMELPPP
jgi:hypothetical protein